MLVNPHVELLDGGRKVRLFKEYIWYDKNDQYWVAYEGLICDGASIPRIAWSIIGSPFTGLYRNAAILHDAYYSRPSGRSRKATDKMFYEKMIEDGIHIFKAKLMYRTVRFFGKKYWNSGI